MLSCQLAKIYGKDKTPKSKNGYFITEKLDGIRCIAEFNGEKWIFTSRSGKILDVNFDLSTFNKNRVYDGEIITAAALSDRKKTDFNALNGLIQKKGNKNGLIYIVFDIQDEELPYIKRRKELNAIQGTKTAQILPVLAHCKDEAELNAKATELLKTITDNGGEGVMINNADAVYKTTRTNDLLKVKNNYTIDLQVIGITPGAGKCANMIGALQCKTVADEKIIICDVGGGFNNADRKKWFDNPSEIIGKIIEVKYFELTQNAETQGSQIYSLRFPRFVRIRNDKNESSEIIEATKNPTQENEKELKEPNNKPTTNQQQTNNKNILSLVKGFFIGAGFAIYFIFAFIAFMFEVDFLFDVFGIGKKKK